MKTISRYTLKSVDEQLIEIPQGAEILTAQIMYGKLNIWAMVDKNRPNKLRQIWIYRTGHIISNTDNLRYISTVQYGDLVSEKFHVFETK